MLPIEDEPVIFISSIGFHSLVFLIAAGFFGWGTVFYWWLA